MLVKDFNFELPEYLIARYPTPDRTASRLLYLDEKREFNHKQFKDFLDLVNPGDLLVLNNTEVIPARLFSVKPTGGRVEILIERILNASQVLAHVKGGKSLKPGSYLSIEISDFKEKPPHLKFIERDLN